MGSSASFGSKKRPAGKVYRSYGPLARLVTDIYNDVDAGFLTLETNINAGWEACDAATTANISNLSSASVTQDGVTLVAGNRLLVWNQTSAQNNGIYIVGTVSGGNAPLTRAADLNSVSEIQLGDTVFVKGGTLYGSSTFRVTAVPATLGTNPLIFGLVSKAASFSGEIDYINPITKTGTAVFDPSSVPALRAQATHVFGPTLPAGATITKSWYQVITTFTSATDAATIELGVETASPAGIKAGVAISNAANPWDSGVKDGLQVGSAANFTAATTVAGKRFVATVAAETLTNNATAGKLVLHFEYDIVK